MTNQNRAVGFYEGSDYLPNIHDVKALAGYDKLTDKFYFYDGDEEGRLLVRNMVVNPDTLEWENQKQGTPSGTATEVEVTNWPATQPVSGTVSVSENNKAQIVYEDGTVLYVCKAAIGSALDSAAWQIQQVETADPIRTKWCDGNANYDNVATNLITVKALSYS